MVWHDPRGAAAAELPYRAHVPVGKVMIWQGIVLALSLPALTSHSTFQDPHPIGLTQWHVGSHSK